MASKKDIEELKASILKNYLHLPQSSELEKASFILYADDVIQLLQLIPECEGKELLKAIASYSMFGTFRPDEMQPRALGEFLKIMNRITKDTEKWKSSKQKRSEAGKKGGAPEGNQNAKRKSEQETASDYIPF